MLLFRELIFLVFICIEVIIFLLFFIIRNRLFKEIFGVWLSIGRMVIYTVIFWIVLLFIFYF